MMTKKNSMPRLARFKHRIKQKSEDPSAPPLLIVALGDSVTQGLTGLDEIAHEEVYHARFKRDLQQRYPLATFSVINAGVSGQTAADGLSRLNRDVIRYQPDLVLIAFGLNDAAIHGHSGLDSFGDTLVKIVQQIHDETETEVVLLTPNMMLTRTNNAVPTCYQEYVELMMQSQTNGVLTAYAERIQKISQDTGVVLADVYRMWMDMASDGIDTTAMLANGLNHPTADAHAIASGVLARMIFTENNSE